jgi:hypothetical protein
MTKPFAMQLAPTLSPKGKLLPGKYAEFDSAYALSAWYERNAVKKGKNKKKKPTKESD